MTICFGSSIRISDVRRLRLPDQSLSNAAGAIAAMEVGFATIFSSYAMGGILLAFFVTSSLLTRVSSSMKRRIDAEFKEGGQRDWKQA